MPLRCPPPGPAELTALPRLVVAGRSLWRVFQRHRTVPLYFAAVDPADPLVSGRFDLPSPLGSCYTATTKIAAVLESLQDYGSGVLPERVLQRRAVVRVDAPAAAPSAVQLTAASMRGVGATAALWAGADRVCTQAWASQLHRAGWRAAYHGISHDPGGRLRAVTLFDREGEHLPYDDDAWQGVSERLDDPVVVSALAGYGIHVLPGEPELPFVPLDGSGLLDV